MKVLLSYLPLLGCAGAMVACMRMMRSRSNRETQPDGGEIDPEEFERRRATLERST